MLVIEPAWKRHEEKQRIKSKIQSSVFELKFCLKK
jgi:hypothetical protein